jgi:hypothetical protein
MLASMLGHAACVKFLVQKGADCLAMELMQGLSAIHLATREGHAACIDAMLTTEPEILDPELARATPSQILNATTTSGFSALHYAVSFARHNCLETLLKYSPSLCPGSRGVYSPEIGMLCTRGSTPLHIAAHTNNLRAAFFILRQYCHVAAMRAADGSVTPDPRQIRDNMARTPYQVAMQARLMSPRDTDPGLAALLALDADLQSMTQMQMPSFGPPKLSVIASGVLKVKLLADLQQAVDVEAQFSPSRRGGDILAINEALVASEALMAELEGAGTGTLHAGSQAQGITTSAICFICFDAEPDVTISGCNHQVCRTCAKAIVEKSTLCKILACPFCRKPVRGFE